MWESEKYFRGAKIWNISLEYYSEKLSQFIFEPIKTTDTKRITRESTRSWFSSSKALEKLWNLHIDVCLESLRSFTAKRSKVSSARNRKEVHRSFLVAPCHRKPHRPIGIPVFYEALIKMRATTARATVAIYSGQVYRLSCDPIRTGYRVPGSAYTIPTVARIYTRAPSEMDCSTCKGGSWGIALFPPHMCFEVSRILPRTLSTRQKDNLLILCYFSA